MESYGKCDSWWGLNVAAGKFGRLWRTSWSNHQERRDKNHLEYFCQTFGWEFKITSSEVMFNYWLSIRKADIPSLAYVHSVEIHTPEKSCKIWPGISWLPSPIPGLIWNAQPKADGCTTAATSHFPWNSFILWPKCQMNDFPKSHSFPTHIF